MAKPPTMYCFKSLRLTGEATPNAAVFQAVVELQVLQSTEYSECRIFDKNVAVQDATVFGDAFRTEYKPQLCWKGDYLCLIATKGTYTISATLQVPYTTNLGQALSLEIPKCTKSTMKFTVPHRGMDITVTPAIRTVTVEGDKKAKETVVECVLPPSTNVAIKWNREVLKIEAESSNVADDLAIPRKERVVTCSQEIVHTIVGGVLVTSAELCFKVMNAGVSKFEVLLNSSNASATSMDKLDLGVRCRVLSVEGQGIKTWDVTDSPAGQLVAVVMEGAVEGEHTIHISTELDLVDTSCLAAVPTFSPSDVNRVKGSIAVQGLITVEVTEESSKALSKVDQRELSDKCRSLPNVKLAYKFLSHMYNLVIKVMKHADMEVLVAAAEEAIYDITHTGTHLLYSCFYKIKNTQCQFAALVLPPDSVVWSTLVSNEPVKPGVTEHDQILVPLLKSTESSFTVEIIFVRTVPPMTELAGSINEIAVHFPSIDLPINKMCVTLKMPKNVKYSDWAGSLKEVDNFSIVCNRYNIVQPKVQMYYQREQVCKSKGIDLYSSNRNGKKKMGHWGAKNSSYDDLDDNMYGGLPPAQPALFLSNMAPGAGKEDRGGSSGAVVSGVQPLKLDVDALMLGQTFRFEKMLVQSCEIFELRTSYRPERRAELRRRLEDRKSCVVQ